MEAATVYVSISVAVAVAPSVVRSSSTQYGPDQDVQLFDEVAGSVAATVYVSISVAVAVAPTVVRSISTQCGPCMDVQLFDEVKDSVSATGVTYTVDVGKFEAVTVAVESVQNCSMQYHWPDVDVQLTGGVADSVAGGMDVLVVVTAGSGWLDWCAWVDEPTEVTAVRGLDMKTCDVSAVAEGVEYGVEVTVDTWPVGWA